MSDQNIFIINSQSLYDILEEVKNLFNFKIFKINEKDINKNTFIDYDNYVILTSNIESLKKNPNIDVSKILFLNEIPITLNKLIEKINIFTLKESYQSQSEKIIKDYSLNLNDRTILRDKKKTKLTEKELQLILFLDKKNSPQNITTLQNEIWGYKESLETHTVETHIYRLRKKIEKDFSDKNFINSNKEGYFL
jgi:hypothetical protein